MRALAILVAALLSGCAVKFPEATENDRAFAAAVAAAPAPQDQKPVASQHAGPGAIALLADAFRSTDPNAVHRAERALADLVHESARPGAGRERRQSVLALESLLDATPPLPPTERRYVCRMLGIAVTDAAEVARLEARRSDARLADDVAFALERCGATKPTPSIQDASTTRPESRCAALCALASSNHEDADAALLSALADESVSVRATAVDLLAARTSGGLDAKLVRAFDGADPDGRGRIVQLLERRQALDDATIERVIASHDEAPRVALARVLGARTDATSERRLGELALQPRSSTMRANEAVLAGLVRHAERHAFAGQKEAAADSARLVLASSKDDATRAAAMNVFAVLADPVTLPFVDVASADAGPRTRASAVRARLAMADRLKASDPAAATELLRAIVGQPENRRARESALRRLTAQGVDAKDVIAKTGVILDWRVLGPLPRDTTRFGEPSPVPDVSSSMSIQIGDAMIGWRSLSTNDLDGHVDLLARFDGRHDAVAFAGAKFLMDEACTGTLEIGSDDGVAVWLNGERLLAKDVPRGWSPGEEKVAARFVKGENLLLLQITQGGGDWGYSARVVRDAASGGR